MAQTMTASGNVTNAGTATLTSGNQTTGTGNVSIQLVVTKVSGTISGTAKPQGSIDGANWVDLPSQTAFTLTDVATQSTIWYVQNQRAAKYRVLVTGSGTMVATPSGTMLLDKN